MVPLVTLSDVCVLKLEIEPMLSELILLLHFTKSFMSDSIDKLHLWVLEEQNRLILTP